MKSFADNSFFLLFEEIVRRDKPNEATDRWVTAGVSWQHARHSYQSADYGFAIETYEASSSSKGWTLIVVKEHWWAGRNGDIIRSAHWAKPLRGNRTSIITWLRSRQREIEGKP
ncbi:MAG TPA: hypothetical protein VMF67_14245 [Rhizomicrobium sp.]|nr:hypothetical protein [Rhizomicrobium sp.]